MRKMTKIEIITRPEKLEALKEGMNKIGVTGIVLTRVDGDEPSRQGQQRQAMHRRCALQPGTTSGRFGHCHSQRPTG